MKIRLLTENLASGMEWLAEWGFSAWIEYEGQKILFDSGFSQVYQHNAELAGIDLETVDFVALSHFHRDHSRGLLFHPFKKKKKLLLHPRILTAKYKTKNEKVHHDYRNIQSLLTSDFELIQTKEARELTAGAFFLGEIPRITAFEKGCFFDDPMEDDSALAFKTNKGAVVVSGCSHAGICNICLYAQEVTGQELCAVIGGFHLLEDEDPPVEETIEFFKQEKPEHLLPVHCIDFDIQARLQTIFGYDRPGAGSLIEL